MPTGVRIPERIPQRVAVAVERLRIRRIGNYCVRLDEASQRASLILTIHSRLNGVGGETSWE